MLRTAKSLHEETGSKNLVMAGGVALNCVGNGRILREKGPFDQIWIQPAAGDDADGALGTALFIWHQLLENERTRDEGASDSQRGSYLGPAFRDDEIATFSTAPTRGYARPARATTHSVRSVADLIASENVIGWFEGRMEFGPRALGAQHHRRRAARKMQSVMNLKIKFANRSARSRPIVMRPRSRILRDA